LKENNSAYTGSSPEINVFDLLFLIVNNKFKILISLILFASIGILYINLYPPAFKVSIKIDPISYEEESNYEFLNSIKLSNVEEDQKIKFDGDEFKVITAEKLLDIFINELSTLEGITKSLEKNSKSIEFSEIKNPDEKNDLLLKIAKGFKIQEELNWKKTKLSYIVTFSSRDITEAKLILEDALEYTNKQVQSAVSNELKNIKNALANDVVYESKSIALSTLLYLKSQYVIAEKFSVNEPILEAKVINLLKENVQWETKEFPLYLLGTQILEQHINDLENIVDNVNSSERDFLEVLSSIGVFALNPLNQLSKVSRLEEAIMFSPVNKDTFRSANYQIDLIDFSKSAMNTIIMIILIIIGFIFGVFISLISSLASRSDKNPN
jgi:LPS O-antigen subunit length determinant protein (WzzB/FepE family)